MENSKKCLIICIVFLILAVVPAMAEKNGLGIGLYGKFITGDLATGGGVGLTIRYGSFPVIGLAWNFLPNSFPLDGSLDYWIINYPIGNTKIFYYYLGVGGYFALMNINSSDSYFNIGARVPLGLQAYFIEPLELFIEVAPALVFYPTIRWTITGRLGFRIFF